jgi:hypothetical protein
VARRTTGKGKGSHRSSTPLLEFSANQPFRFSQQNASPTTAQEGVSGERYLTSLSQFSNRVVAANPQVFRILAAHRRIPVLAPERWAETGFRGRRVLFLLPSQALGGNVATLLFLEAFAGRHRPAGLGVFCAGSTADIYLLSERVEVHTLWLGRRQLKRYDVVIDLGQLENRRDIEIWPVDMEADLLAAFGLEPSPRYPARARPFAPKAKPHFGLLPLASSPLRTLPVALTEALSQALVAEGEVTLCLNRSQHQGVLYARELKHRLPAGVTVIDGFASIGELLAAIDGFDYAVLADSGPAHMAKLFATPGVAVYTSAPGEVLQGRFENLRRFAVDFQGPRCTAPCGLAKLRQTAAGAVGCMASLDVDLEDLPTTPKGQDAEAVERLVLHEPVPCVAALSDQRMALVDFVRADLAERIAAGGAS